MRRCDLLVTHGLLVDAHDGVREDAALAVEGNRLIEVGPSKELASRYRAERTLDARDKAILPGLINAHTHASATLFRGYAADVSGRDFFERIWPIEALLTDEDVYVGALAGCLEMIKNGVTGFANHFSHMDQVARAVEETGIRAGLSRTMLDRGESGDAKREVEEGVRFAERWAGRCSRIQPMLGPHAAYTCSDELLRLAAEEARRTGLILHIHVAESPHERELISQRTGTTTVQHLERLGFFTGNRVLGAHALLLDDEDLRVLSDSDFHAAICATGKMNRGQGIADLPRMLGAGINICLGTDGSASDNLDLLMAMKVTYIAGASPASGDDSRDGDGQCCPCARLGDGAARTGPAGGLHPGRYQTASAASAHHQAEIQRDLQPRLLRDRRRRGLGGHRWKAGDGGSPGADGGRGPGLGSSPGARPATLAASGALTAPGHHGRSRAQASAAALAGLARRMMNPPAIVSSPTVRNALS